MIVKWCAGELLVDFCPDLVSIFDRFCDFVGVGGHCENSAPACTGVIFSRF